MLPQTIARRSFLFNSGISLGSMALSSLLRPQQSLAADSNKNANDGWKGVIQPLHHAAKAKRII